jgi:hypothetical protein
VDWALILLVAAIALVGAAALAAAVASAGGEHTREGSASERMAIWQAGYTARELRILAGVAALARTDLDASEVEVVLTRGGGTRDGIVVTGSRLPEGRLGAAVAADEGLSGRGLAAGRTTLAGLGTLPDAIVAMAVPIEGPDGIAGVITATTSGERLFEKTDVSRLEALAAEAGSRLGIRAASLRDAG